MPRRASRVAYALWSLFRAPLSGHLAPQSDVERVSAETSSHAPLVSLSSAQGRSRASKPRRLRGGTNRLGLPNPEDPEKAPSESRDARPSQFGQQLSNKIYVGNLPFSSTEEDLRSVFSAHGNVESVNVITDRDTGRPRGFAFVEMADAGAASNAIRALDGSELGGRNLRVNEAEDKRRGGGFGGR